MTLISNKIPGLDFIEIVPGSELLQEVLHLLHALRHCNPESMATNTEFAGCCFLVGMAVCYLVTSTSGQGS